MLGRGYNKKVKKAVKGKGKKGKGGPWDDAAFERDMLLAIEASKREAGLAEQNFENVQVMA